MAGDSQVLFLVYRASVEALFAIGDQADGRAVTSHLVAHLDRDKERSNGPHVVGTQSLLLSCLWLGNGEGKWHPVTCPDGGEAGLLGAVLVTTTYGNLEPLL